MGGLTPLVSLTLQIIIDPLWFSKNLVLSSHSGSGSTTNRELGVSLKAPHLRGSVASARACGYKCFFSRRKEHCFNIPINRQLSGCD